VLKCIFICQLRIKQKKYQNRNLSNQFSIKYYDGLEQWGGKNNEHLTRGKIHKNAGQYVDFLRIHWN